MVCNKSSQTVYNTTAQTVTPTLTTITLLGTQALDTGCSLKSLPSGFAVKNSGMYRVSYDITFTPTAAGTVVIQLYKDTTPLPCAMSTTTSTVGAIFTTHIETTIWINACCAVQSVISAAISGGTGTINRVCANIIRYA